MNLHQLEYLVEHVAKPLNHQDGDTRDGIVLALAYDSVNDRRAIFPPNMTRNDIWDIKRLRSVAQSSIGVVDATGGLGCHQSTVSLGSSKLKVITTAYEGGVYLAVVVRSGHEVAKSLARMIRIAARREGLKRLNSPLTDTMRPDGEPSALPNFTRHADALPIEKYDDREESPSPPSNQEEAS